MEEIIISNSTTPTFVNKNLQKATNDILKVGKEMRRCALITAVIIAKVDETECYKDDGFNNVHAWTLKTFGLKKTASHSLLKIGKDYVREIINPKNGRVTGYTTNLLPEDSDRDFTTTQVEKMLPGGHDLAETLVSSGEITPEMSCKDIEKVIRSYTNPKEENDETPGEIVDVDDEPEIDNEEYKPDVLLTIRCIEYLDGRKAFEIDGKEFGIDKVVDIVSFLNDFCNGSVSDKTFKKVK